MKFFLCSLVILLAGCAQTLPPPLPAMPNMKPELLGQNWPANEAKFQVSGSLCLYFITIPIQGIVSMEEDGSAVSIALLTQMGTSIFEAKLNRDGYEMFTVSPMLKKHPQLEPMLIRMAKALYLPEPVSTVCTSEGKKNIAQLRCPEQNILYSYTVVPQRADKIQLRRRINAENETTVYLKNWQDEHGIAYPTRLYYKDAGCGFVAKLSQKPISCPHNIVAEKAS